MTHNLQKSEHLIVRAFLISLKRNLVRIRMKLVVELHDLEIAFIYIKVDVPLLKIRGDGFPGLGFWVLPLDCFPGM